MYTQLTPLCAIVERCILLITSTLPNLLVIPFGIGFPIALQLGLSIVLVTKSNLWLNKQMNQLLSFEFYIYNFIFFNWISICNLVLEIRKDKTKSIWNHFVFNFRNCFINQMQINLINFMINKTILLIFNCKETTNKLYILIMI